MRKKYHGEEDECDDDCQTKKTQVTAEISRVQGKTNKDMDMVIEKTKEETVFLKKFKEEMYLADDILKRHEEGNVDQQMALDEMEQRQRASRKNVMDNPRLSNEEKNTLIKVTNKRKSCTIVVSNGHNSNSHLYQ